MSKYEKHDLDPDAPEVKLADTIARSVGMSFDPDLFAEAMKRQHRTLQQQTFRAFIACIKRWAEAHAARDFDMRNQRTCELSRDIINKSSVHEDFYVPYI